MMIYLLPILFIFLLYLAIRNNYKRDMVEGVCAICDEVFLERELEPIEDLFLCKKHFNIYQEAKWSEVKVVESSAADPSKSLYIQDLKDELKTLGIPGFIQTRYRHDGHEIISVFSFSVREQDLSRLGDAKLFRQ